MLRAALIGLPSSGKTTLFQLMTSAKEAPRGKGDVNIGISKVPDDRLDILTGMYNPKKRPFVSHERGTELVIEHIERHICPSVLADDISCEPESANVVFVIGEDEYKKERARKKAAKQGSSWWPF